MKFLVAGWFSFEHMGASAGDLRSRDLVCRWLSEDGLGFDVVVAAPFADGISWDDADPTEYAGLVFVCGPFGNGPPLTEVLPRFAGLPLIGINLTLLQSLKEWNPFDLLFERDSDEVVRPDLVFLTEKPKVPVAGLILVHPQKEYGERGMHHVANEALQKLMESREMAVVPIDTRLDENRVGLRSPGEVEALVARMDVVVTTRLHGMVMALKNGVPALVVDPIAGGAKIQRQAQVIGWERVYLADHLDRRELEQGLDYCLSAAGKVRAAEVAENAGKRLAGLKEQLLQGLHGLTTAET